MKKKVYIILGKSNSRKSSVLRCLTGCAVTQGEWNMRLLSGTVEDFYISVTSPQERNKIGIPVNEFIQEISERNENKLIIALQSRSTSQQPNGENYLQAFINAGFDIQTIVCFDENANTLNLPVQHYNSLEVPTNQTASEVRNMWGIV
jgi:hypothetical protein